MSKEAMKPLPSLSYRLGLLVAANSISGFAQGITWISIPWYLVSARGDTDGKYILTLMGACITALTVIWGLYAGTLIDKYNRKFIFLGNNLFGGMVLGLGALWLAVPLGSEVPALVAVSATTFLVFTLHYPNLYAFVQELFPPSYYARVNSGIEIQGQLTNFVGMTIGSILVAGVDSVTLSYLPFHLVVQPWTMSQIFALNACTYLVATGIIALIPYKPKPDHGISSQGTVWNRLQTGTRYLMERPRLLLFGICSYMVFFAALITFQGILPIYIRDVLRGNGSLLGLAEACFAFGALLAGLVSLWLLRHGGQRRNVVLIQLQLAGAVALLSAYALAPSIGLLLGGAVLFGLMNSTTRINRLSLLLSKVPNHLIGRVNSFFQVTNGAFRALFMLLLSVPYFSAPANGANIRWAMLLMAAILLISGITLLFFPPMPTSESAQSLDTPKSEN